MAGAAKKTTAKKTTAGKPNAAQKAVSDPLAAVPEVCSRCGRDATQRHIRSGRPVCDRHAARIGGQMGKL